MVIERVVIGHEEADSMEAQGECDQAGERNVGIKGRWRIVFAWRIRQAHDVATWTVADGVSIMGKSKHKPTHPGEVIKHDSSDSMGITRRCPAKGTGDTLAHMGCSIHG